jgi:hypothetical protein
MIRIAESSHPANLTENGNDFGINRNVYGLFLS